MPYCHQILRVYVFNFYLGSSDPKRIYEDRNKSVNYFQYFKNCSEKSYI